MRQVECICGEFVESKTDAGLFDELRRHADEEHPGTYSDAELKTLIATRAYDGVGART